MKKLIIGNEARENAVKALDLIASAIGSTLGPQGRPFVFERMGADQQRRPTVSKDGLTVLNSLEFSEPIANAIHYFAQQAAAHSVIASGDGTTSTCVLASAVAKAIHVSKSSVPQALARQLRKEALNAIEVIKKEADKSESCVKQVAMTSANGDEELTEVVLDAIKLSSAFGTIVVEKAPASKERYKIVRQDGYIGAKGYNYNNTFAYSCGDAAAQNAPLEWRNPNVMVFNGHLMVPEQLAPIMSAFNEKIKESGDGQRLVIFAYETSDEIMNRLIVFNRQMASRDIAVFIAKPRLTAEINSGLQVIRDVAAYTGSNIIDGGNYKTVTKDDFGTCNEIKITPTQTLLFGRAKNHWVEKRAQQNENIIATAESQFDREITSIRNAELTEGLVKVEVGGGLLPDLQERADRFDDASKAAQACMRGGALPGCGASYIRAGELAGVSDTMKKALRIVHDTIMSNYGTSPLQSFKKGDTVKIDEENGIQVGNFRELGVLDATETICAVIKNGVDLGIETATLGGYSLVDTEDLKTIQRARSMRESM